MLWRNENTKIMFVYLVKLLEGINYSRLGNTQGKNNSQRINVG